ncbi:hypothetical protein CDL12_06644 [Handroanthus impetiginosus]|uniref:Uncharacterized protein n=1 Tax=Handroanthus impetiginosus TaxID=429701 RepID=A0A2G9HT74_9LAMI|nr:hypothetical protein CDL12_06644 [Handroanthus impetiginosus]
MAEHKGIDRPVSHSDKGEKSPNLIDPTKEENEEVIHSDKSHKHHKETHGTSDDIDEKTPIDEVKGPNVFQRVKEEIEAVVESVLPKK